LNITGKVLIPAVHANNRNSGVRANAQRKRQHRQCRERRIMPDGSRGITQIVKELVQKCPAPTRTSFLLDQAEVPKLSPRRQLRLLFGETGFPALLHLLFQMKLQLLSELIFLASSGHERGVLRVV
jgi:hypothetical protein